MPRYAKIILAVIALIAVIGYGVPYYYTSSSKTCGSCHSMQPYYTSWKESAHSVAASNCLYCHVKPGFFNLLKYRIYFWSEIYAHYTGEEVMPASTSLPTTESCYRIGCHSLNRLTSRDGDVKIEHLLHVKQAKVSCPECHPGAVHRGVTGEPIPSRELCKRCHGDRMSDCKMCHTRSFPLNLEFEH